MESVTEKMYCSQDDQRRVFNENSRWESWRENICYCRLSDASFIQFVQKEGRERRRESSWDDTRFQIAIRSCVSFFLSEVFFMVETTDLLESRSSDCIWYVILLLWFSQSDSLRVHQRQCMKDVTHVLDSSFHFHFLDCILTTLLLKEMMMGLPSLISLNSLLRKRDTWNRRSNPSSKVKSFLQNVYSLFIDSGASSSSSLLSRQLQTCYSFITFNIPCMQSIETIVTVILFLILSSVKADKESVEYAVNDDKIGIHSRPKYSHISKHWFDLISVLVDNDASFIQKNNDAILK